jgi:hypothetical protein
MKIFPSAKSRHNVDAKVVTYTLDGYVGISVGEEWWKAPYEDTDRFEDTVCVDTEKNEQITESWEEQIDKLWHKAYNRGFNDAKELLK